MRQYIVPVLAAILGLLFTAASPAADTYVPDSLKSNIPPPQFDASSWILQDQKSGWVITAKDPEQRVEPASISKLMTAYVVFDELTKGNLKEEDLVLISERAWKTEGSRMFVKVNTRVPIDELLRGLIVQSGNDAAVALAEHIAGSEEGFVDLMNQTAARLGLRGTQYQNSTGLPHPDHYSTARDISELSRALIRDFPKYYELYSIKSYTYNKISQRNRNVLLWRDDAVDGVKTGHTSSAGYCLVGSAEKEGMRLIATVMGTASTKDRADAVYALLTHGFSAYEGFLVYDRNDVVRKPELFKGTRAEVEAVVKRPLYVTVAKGAADKISAKVSINGPLIAPVQQGQEVGSLALIIKGEQTGSVPLVALEGVEQGSWFGRMYDSIKLLFY